MYPVSGCMEHDARLTLTGHRQAEIVGSELEKIIDKLNLIPIPIIFTSILSRAIETGDIISKFHDNEPLYVVPFIEEKPFSVNLSKFIYLDRQNAPRNKKILEDELNVELNVIESANPYKNDEPYLIVEIQKFYEIILGDIVKFLKSHGFIIDENTVIILVSHRNTIDMATGIRNLGNCGIVLQEVFKENGVWKRDMVSGSEIIFDGFTHEEGSQNTNKEDLINCKCSRVYNFI